MQPEHERHHEHQHPDEHPPCQADVETAGIVLAERLRGGQVLLARDLVEIPDEGYLIRRDDQLRLDPVVLNRITALSG